MKQHKIIFFILLYSILLFSLPTRANKKLIALDDNNIIEIGDFVNHLVGGGINITCQPQNLSNIDPTLILVRSSTMKYPIDLCRVEYAHFQSSNEFGDTLDFHLRTIDENLNPYHRLIE